MSRDFLVPAFKFAALAVAAGYLVRTTRAGTFGELGQWIAPIALVVSLVMSVAVLLLILGRTIQILQNPKAAIAALIGVGFLVAAVPKPERWIAFGRDCVLLIMRLVIDIGQ